MAKSKAWCPHDCVPRSFNPAALAQKTTCLWCGHELTMDEKADRLGLNDAPPSHAELRAWDSEGDDDSPI